MAEMVYKPLVLSHLSKESRITFYLTRRKENRMDIRELLTEIMGQASEMSRPVRLYNKERNIHIDISGVEWAANMRQLDIEFDGEPPPQKGE